VAFVEERTKSVLGPICEEMHMNNVKTPTLALALASSLSLSACATTPQEERTLQSAGTGAAIGAVAGAGVGAVVGGLSPIAGAAIGAAVGGLAGAVWADHDNDGYADGYVREGQYYQGAPAAPAPAAYEPPAPVRSGERG
jgi:hypothetical protein